VIVEDWRCDYNANEPHSTHGDLTRNEFALQASEPAPPSGHSRLQIEQSVEASYAKTPGPLGGPRPVESPSH
jgi:hypothetical protein